MKSAPEILLDESITRGQRDARERQWESLVARCRSRRPPLLVQLGLVGLFAAVIYAAGQPSGAVVVGSVTLLVVLAWHIVHLRQLERALRELIEQHAPELHDRLRAEGII